MRDGKEPIPSPGRFPCLGAVLIRAAKCQRPGREPWAAANRGGGGRGELSFASFSLALRLPYTRMQVHWADFCNSGFRSQTTETRDTKQRDIPGERARKSLIVSGREPGKRQGPCVHVGRMGFASLCALRPLGMWRLRERPFETGMLCLEMPSFTRREERLESSSLKTTTVFGGKAEDEAPRTENRHWGASVPGLPLVKTTPSQLLRALRASGVGGASRPLGAGRLRPPKGRKVWSGPWDGTTSLLSSGPQRGPPPRH